MIPLILTLATAAVSSARRPGAPAPRPAEPLAVVTFHLTAEVRDRVIRLRDVALVEGSNADLVARLQSVEVGSAPLHGHSRQVSAQYARIRVRQAGVDAARLLFDGAQLVTVTRPDQRLAGAALAKAAREALEAANPGAAAEVTCSLTDLRLPPGTVELKAQCSTVAGSTTVTVPVQVLVEGRQEALVTVSLRLVRRTLTVIAARDLPLGTVLSEDDLRVEERPVLPGPLVVSDPVLAIGKQVTMPIRGGVSLTASMLKPAMILKRGARVKLVCRGPSFTVTAAGEALQDAAAGQPVRVRNLTSLREVTGQALDAQTVEVPF